MTRTPRILLIDDGELEPVAAMLDGLGVEHVRLRGGLVEVELAPPSDLLIATPRRAGAVRRGSPAGAAAGRPLRIIAVDEDSTAMRRMLRRMGFHLLVRRGAHPDVWRLLVERALFEGDERRVDVRVPVGAAVSFTSDGESAEASNEHGADRAVLIDISNRGCRIRTTGPLRRLAQLSLEIPLQEPGAEVLRLSGQVVRTGADAASADSPSADSRHTSAMLFDSALPAAERARLGQLLNDLSVGPGTIEPADVEPLPACKSPVIPGLMLNDETDPALPAGVEVGLQRASAPEPATNRRQTPRGVFGRRVVALADESCEQRCRVLIGRDLSAGGMRIEPTPELQPDDRFQLAIYGPGQPHPFIVQAIVDRDDDAAGIALRFTGVTADIARGLEKLVACLPDIESLEDGESAGLGAVISEILSHSEGS
jgi:hypothetical protein